MGSHFSQSVVEATLENDIKFITLPPNATHFCQPLDVAVFRGLKESWRKILSKWRMESRVHGAIPKENLPTLLSRLINKLVPENLVSGFRATGLYPRDRQQVLKRLPGAENRDEGGADTSDILNETVLDLLKENLGIGVEKVVKRKPRGPKISAGQKIMSLDKQNEAPLQQEAGPSSSTNPSTAVTSAESASCGDSETEEVWYCGVCRKKWLAISDDVWIQCDSCDMPFHLQCCGLDYDKK